MVICVGIDTGKNIMLFDSDDEDDNDNWIEYTPFVRRDLHLIVLMFTVTALENPCLGLRFR